MRPCQLCQRPSIGRFCPDCRLRLSVADQLEGSLPAGVGCACAVILSLGLWALGYLTYLVVTLW